MRTAIAFLLCLLAFRLPAQLVMTNDIVPAMSGDSITQMYRYAPYIATGYLGKYPNATQHWRFPSKSGQGMDGAYSVPNMKALTDKWVAPTQPSVYFLLFTPNLNTASNTFYTDLECLATNAANGFGAGDFGTVITTKAGTNYNGAQVVLLGQIPGSAGNGPQKDQDRSTAHKLIAQLYGYQFCDSYAYLQAPVSNHQAQATYIDGTHPGNAMSAMMWYAIEDSLHEFDGTNKIISTVVIDATHQTASSVTNATIGSISTTSTGGSFTWLSGRNPAAFDTGPDANGVDSIAGAIAVFPGIYTNQPYMLYFSNLVDQTYTLSIDGVAVTNLATSSGVLTANITALQSGPIFRQLTNLLYLVRLETGVVPTNVPGKPSFNNKPAPNVGWIEYNSNADVQFGLGKTNQALHDSLATYEAHMRLFDATNQGAAMPVTRTFTLAPAGAPPAPVVAPVVFNGNVVLRGNISIRN